MTTTTPSKTATSVFPLRAERELLQEVKALAKKRRVSANRVVVEAVMASLKAEREREWREGFEAMGRDPDTEVEYLLPAAREIVLGD